MRINYPFMESELIEYYLHLLGVERQEPSFDALCELVQAHMVTVPFENISKLHRYQHLGLQGLPGLEAYLNGIDQFHFGGTCYTNNFYFYQLLANLGYQAKLCGAAMARPDVHMVSLVTVEQREYVVDVGYAAPFLAPLPRDLATDYVLELGRDRYVLKPQDAAGYSRLELHREGKLKHGYVINPMPRQIQDFEAVIADSFRADATFMNALLLTRFFPNRSLVVHNLTVIESEGTTFSVRMLPNRETLVQTISDCFGIPAEIVLDVMQGMGELGDAWS